MFTTNANLTEINAGALDQAIDAYLDGFTEEKVFIAPDDFIFDTIQGGPLTIVHNPPTVETIINDLYEIRVNIEDLYKLTLEDIKDTLENYSNSDDSDIVLDSLHEELDLYKELLLRVPDFDEIKDLNERFNHC